MEMNFEIMNLEAMEEVRTGADEQIFDILNDKKSEVFEIFEKIPLSEFHNLRSLVLLNSSTSRLRDRSKMIVPNGTRDAQWVIVTRLNGQLLPFQTCKSIQIEDK